MEKTEFFKKIDGKLGKDAEDLAHKQTRQNERSAIHRKIVAAAIPLLEEYKHQLEQRGIWVKSDSEGEYFSFQLSFSNGGHWGLRLERDGFRRLISQEGTNYTASAFIPDDERWEIGKLEEVLQATIDEFFQTAKSQGGYRMK